MLMSDINGVKATNFFKGRKFSPNWSFGMTYNDVVAYPNVNGLSSIRGTLFHLLIWYGWR